jgi:hypothetical protein
MNIPKREIPIGNNASGDLFLKLGDGESKIGVCRGDLYEFFQVWENNRSRLVKPDEPGAKSRFRLNFVSYEDGKFVARIWEFGLMVYNQLADINEEYPLEKTKLKVTRKGKGTDTVYMILPMLKEPISAKGLKDLDGVTLNVLVHPEKSESKGTFESEMDEELPF